MNVVAASYQAVSILRGGPNTQVRNTMKHMASNGISFRLFDPWKSFAPEECDIFHLFAANIGTYHLAREIHTLGIPLVVSPIIYSNHSSRFVRSALSISGILKKMGRGLWSDYGLAAEICSWAERILPNSQAEADFVRDGLGLDPTRITVVPNGVDGRFANADPSLFKSKYGLDGFILNVGHIGHERKNVLSLIKALGQIDRPAVIIGRIIKGKYGDECVKAASQYRHIVLIDGLDNDSEMLASAYAACDVFALPSLFETPGIAALEAALAGARIVITPHGGTREYFGDMATYVESTVESIKKGIQRALKLPKTDILRTHIQSKYLWRHVAAKTALIYNEVLARR